MTGTSPATAVGETVLSATFPPGAVVQGSPASLTVQAKDSAGNLVTGYQGRVKLASTWNGVAWNAWGGGTTNEFYTFTAADAGSHAFAPKFSYAGDQTVTVTDQALASRTVTSAPLTITNSAPGSYPHDATPAGVKLGDGTLLWAFLGQRGRLYARRNVGTTQEPAWQRARGCWAGWGRRWPARGR